jgi:hypothetical protein
MGDSVENNGDVLDEGKVAKALAVGAMTLASMGAKAHTDTTKSVAQLAKERPALAQRLKDIGAEGQVPASDKRAAELQKKQDQEMPASERRAKELEKMKKEETEEFTMKYIEEKLTAADPASKWISDFVRSDNPKFAGASKKERIQQALGAYYAAKRGKNEEVELDESHGAEKLGDMLESDADHETKMKRIKIAPTAHLKYLHKYNMGYSGGGDHPMIKHIKDELKNRKMKNEEVEQIDELKKSTLASYVNKAANQVRAKSGIAASFETQGTRKRNPENKSAYMDVAKDFRQGAKKRLTGIEKATAKLAKEEIEQVTEAEGKVAVTPKEKSLAAHHGDKTKITFGDVLKARLKSAAAKKMGK